MHEYNTSRINITLREYGRNIHNIVSFIKEEPDRDVRTRLAYTLVSLMKQVAPTVQDYPEYEQKLWDDIYIMSNFELDVDAPFPNPEATLLRERNQEKEAGGTPQNMRNRNQKGRGSKPHYKKRRN